MLGKKKYLISYYYVVWNYVRRKQVEAVDGGIGQQHRSTHRHTHVGHCR